MKKVLVTGGSGFIGANLVRRLLADGHDVHLLMRPQFSDWRIRGVQPDLEIHTVDPTSGEAIEAVMQRVRPAWVFHVAAHGVYAFQDDVAEMVRTNYLFTTLLAQACVRSGVEIMIHTGSSSEYGFKDHAPAEDEPIEPNSYYAVTKAAATQFCRFTARNHAVPMPTLRLYSIYGPFESPLRLMPALVVHGLEKRWPQLVGPDISRDFVHIDDAVDALIALARRPPADPGAVYNLGSGVQTSLREVAALAARIFNIPGEPAWNSMPARAWDTNVWVANPAKIKAELGWAPKTELRRGLELLADWLQSDPRRLEFYREKVSRA